MQEDATVSPEREEEMRLAIREALRKATICHDSVAREVASSYEELITARRLLEEECEQGSYPKIKIGRRNR